LADESLKYQIGIGLISGVGPMTAKKLIAYIGSVEGIFREKKHLLMKIPGIGVHLANEIVNQNVLEKAEKEVFYIEKNEIEAIFYTDEKYPSRLKLCEDSPIMLFVKGKANLNAEKIISIVGTRSATSYGKEICEKLISDLKIYNPLIVSGLAYGIDISAHRAALKNQLSTVAILGHGFRNIYPPDHRNTATEMLDSNGGLITEFFSDDKFEPKNFLRRNRIIAGMSEATIVVESSKKGGAMFTAEMANSYNRDVFAFPARTTDKHSEGCNFLIKINKANLITSAEDVEYLLNWNTEHKSKTQQLENQFITFTEDEQKIISLLKENGKLNIDIIASNVNLSMSETSVLLLNLEFANVIKSLPGKMYDLTFLYKN